MAQYNEDAKVLIDLIKDKNFLKAQIAGSTEVMQILKHTTQELNFEVKNIVIKTTDISGDDCFILDNATKDVLDTDILEVTSSLTAAVEVERRRWEYNTPTLLALGTKDSNIDLTNGDIRLA